MHLPEIQEEKEIQSEKSGQDLLAEFYAKIGHFEDDETREHILCTEFTDDERLAILLLLRLEDAKKHPEQMIDGDTFFANLRKRNKQRQNETI